MGKNTPIWVASYGTCAGVKRNSDGDSQAVVGVVEHDAEVVIQFQPIRKGDIVTEKTTQEPQPVCDYCEKPLGDEIWVLSGLRYKCCSPTHLLLLTNNSKIVSWEEWKNGSLFYP